MADAFGQFRGRGFKASAGRLSSKGITFPKGNPVKGVETYLDKFGTTVSKMVRVTAFKIQRDAKKILNTRKPGRPAPTTNLGLLRDSIKVDIRGEGAKTTAHVYVGKEYGVWVEYGRHGSKTSPQGMAKHSGRAASPPLQAILQWVKERKIRPKGGGLGRDKKTGQFRGLTTGEQSGIAFLIQRHIAEHGIEPQPFLMPPYRRHRKTFKDDLAKAIKGIQI